MFNYKVIDLCDNSFNISRIVDIIDKDIPSIDFSFNYSNEIDISYALFSQDYKIIGTATSDEGVEILNSKGFLGIKLDLNNAASVNHISEKLKEEHKDISILINNAGILRDAMSFSMTEKEFEIIVNMGMN